MRTEGFIYPRAVGLQVRGGQFMGAQGGGGSGVDANRPWLREHETFEVVYLGSNRVAFRLTTVISSVRKMAADSELVANRTVVREWETLSLYRDPAVE